MTNTKAFLKEVAEIERKYNSYFHADGGLLVVSYNTGRTLLGPVEMRSEEYLPLKDSSERYLDVSRGE